MDDRTNILLVDDRHANLIAMQTVLEPLGQILITAQSGKKALKLLLDRDFAVILPDVNMPVMDGFGTAGMIRERKNSQHVPIIFITSHEHDSRKILKGYEMGAVDFIFKLMPADEILRCKISVFVELHKAWMKERDLAHEQQRVQELQAELDYYHALGTKANLPVGETIYGSRSIRWISPPAFHELADSYGRVFDQSLEALTLKIDHDITGQLRQLAETIGFLRAGPRDVAEVHTQVLAAKTQDIPTAKTKALVGEARFQVLELMGHLVSFYRRYYPGSEGPLSQRSTKFETPKGDRRKSQMNKIKLTLFITGQTQRSDRAIINLHQLCEEELNGKCELSIIDVLEQPQVAEDEKILATPTLVKELPLPLRRVIGDLSNRDKVLLSLDLMGAQNSDPERGR